MREGNTTGLCWVDMIHSEVQERAEREQARAERLAEANRLLGSSSPAPPAAPAPPRPTVPGAKKFDIPVEGEGKQATPWTPGRRRRGSSGGAPSFRASPRDSLAKRLSPGKEGSRRNRRFMSLVTLMQQNRDFWNDDATASAAHMAFDPVDLSVADMSCSLFARLLDDDDALELWRSFAALDEEDQRAFLASAAVSRAGGMAADEAASCAEVRRGSGTATGSVSGGGDGGGDGGESKSARRRRRRRRASSGMSVSSDEASSLSLSSAAGACSHGSDDDLVLVDGDEAAGVLRTCPRASFNLIDRRIRAALRKGVPTGMLEHFEREVIDAFGNFCPPGGSGSLGGNDGGGGGFAPDVLVWALESPFERLVAHAVAQYFRLSSFSESCGANAAADDATVPVVEEPRKFFVENTHVVLHWPTTSLAQYLSSLKTR